MVNKYGVLSSIVEKRSFKLQSNTFVSSLTQETLLAKEVFLSQFDMLQLRWGYLVYLPSILKNFISFVELFKSSNQVNFLTVNSNLGYMVLRPPQKRALYLYYLCEI